MKFVFWFAVANAISMVANLAAYAWASHAPASLAVGIINGFAMSMMVQILLHEEQ